MNRLISCSLALTLLAACHTTDRRGVRVNDRDDGPRSVERVYARPAPEVCDAAISAAQKLLLTIDDDRHDRLGGTIVARRANGDRVVMEVTSLDDSRVRVQVQVDPGNGDLAARMHEQIAARLGLGRAKSTMFGGNTAKGSYSCTLCRTATVAEAVLRRLGFEVTRVDVQQETATFDARECDSTPVRIQLDRAGAKVKAEFTVGTTSDNDLKARARRLKSEFERDLAPAPEE
jgi:predicted hotdog family 3-hydroxylacyl-ACP dehydratase